MGTWRRNTPPKRPPAGSREGCDEPAPPVLRAGIAQFNEGRFFDQHETIENLWHDEPRGVRDLYHGIIQIGVGLYHRERGNHHGAVALISKGMARARGLAPTCHGVDVAKLLGDAQAVLEELERLGTTEGTKVPPPVIRWREDAS